MRLPLVSVVVTTKNEGKNIGNCLESIRLQTYPQKGIEIILVDNYSSDQTVEIAKKYTNKIFQYGPERSAQRNFGIFKKAKGEYVLFLDADMILSSTLIEKAVKKLEKSDFVALYLPEIVLGNSFFNQVRRFERSFYDATVIDAVRMIKREVFKKVGGFDLSLTGPEDWDLDKRIRKVGEVCLLENYDFEKIDKKIAEIDTKKAGFVKKLSFLSKKALIYHHDEEFNLGRYLSKKRYYAKSIGLYLQKWGQDDPDLRRQLGFWYRFFLVFLEKGKWKRLVAHPVLTLGMYFLRLAVGGVYLLKRFKNVK